MAGLGFAAVGDFALNTDVSEVFSKEVTDLAGQLADRESLALGHEVEGELPSHKALMGGYTPGYTPHQFA